MVDDDEAGVVLVEQRLDLLDLAAAQQGPGLRLGDRHDQALHDRQVDRPGQADGLLETRLVGTLRRRGCGIGLCRPGGTALLQHRHHQDCTHIVAVTLSLPDHRFFIHTRMLRPRNGLR
jgi:hypothetical protein